MREKIQRSQGMTVMRLLALARATAASRMHCTSLLRASYEAPEKRIFFFLMCSPTALLTTKLAMVLNHLAKKHAERL